MFQISWVWTQMKGYRIKYVFLLVLAMIPQIMMLINPSITRKIVDEVVYKLPEAGEDISGLITKLIFLIVLLVVFTAMRTTIWYTAITGIEECGQRFLLELKNDIFEKLQKQDRAFFKCYQTGDLMTRVTGDAEMAKHGIVHLLRGFLECIVLYSAAAIFMLFRDIPLTLSLMAFTPFIFVLTFRFAVTVHPYYVLLREKLSQLNSRAQENIAGNRVVKAFTRENYEIEQFEEKNREFKEANLTASFIWLKFYPAIEGFSQALPIMVLLLGGYFMMNGRISAGTFLAFNSLCWTLAAPMRTLGVLVNDTQRFFASVDQVISLYEAEPVIRNRGDAISQEEPFKGRIEFRNVSVELENTDILEEVNLVIEPGETIAVMGPTGAGKTTLINCISRFVDVTGGQLLIDGVDVRNYELDTLRKNIAVANQDVFLFSETVNKNIAFGKVDLQRPKVENYARMAKADFVWGMEDGFDTMIGERGTGLSGGQKQRLALARALAVSTPILILDDTTSAVDMETESSIQENLEHIENRCTRIIIAQRYYTASKADRIVILEKGRITELGTHEELLKKNGYYAEICRMQQGEEAQNG